jgi:hypothetical protein
MNAKLLLGLALALVGGAGTFFWLIGHEHSWTQTSEVTAFRSGEKLVRVDHYRSAFVQTTLENSRLYLQQTNGSRELLASSDHYSTANHFVLSQVGDMYVVGVGTKVYYRPKESSENQWHSWALTGTPEICDFIKKYLETHSPGAYAPDTNEFASAGAFKIKCNHLGREQPLIMAPPGELLCAYEIQAIRDQGRELVAAPFASNPYAPQQLIFSQNKPFSGWKFNKTLTAEAN